MSKTHETTAEHYEPGLYEIRIKGHLDDRWADWFEGLTFTHESDGTTLLYGPLADQAALHGVLNGFRDLGLPIISVQRISANTKRSKKMKADVYEEYGSPDVLERKENEKPAPEGGELLNSKSRTQESSRARRAAGHGGAMKAIVQDGYGAPERVLELKEVDRPSVGDDDVLIRVRATSVNTPDWITVAGVPYILRLQSGLRRPSTAVRGTDVAGVVEAVGKNVTDLQPGDEVFGSLWDNTLSTLGTFAELTVAPASQLIKKPATLSFEEAGASVMSGLTALIAMRDVGQVGPGTKVLINGASGGVGTFAVQIAKALGAEVTGVSSTRNLELVRSLGADHVIDYTAEDFTRGEQRYDVIFDNVMNHPPTATARVLAPNGIFIPNSVGNSGGLFAGLPRAARAVLMGRGSTDVRFVTYVVNRENLDALAALLESDEVKVVIDKVYPLSEAANAVAHMLGHHARGKVVITVGAREAGDR